MNQHNTDLLIESLTEGLTPVKCLAHPCRIILPWIVGAGIYVATVTHFLALRSDIHEKLSDAFFWFEIFLAGAVGVFAALASMWLRVPDMRGQRWMISVSLSLFVIFIAWNIAGVVEYGGMSVGDFHWHDCLNNALLLGFVPGAVLAFLAMRGFTTRPFTMVLMNILAATSFAYVGLRFSCAADHMGHILPYHVAPFVVLGVFMGAAARRIYRW